jgi:hypothetical protein
MNNIQVGNVIKVTDGTEFMVMAIDEFNDFYVFHPWIRGYFVCVSVLELEGLIEWAKKHA